MGIPIMRLRTAGFFVGTAFLAWAAFMYTRIMPSEGDHYAQPLVLPISLAPGTITTPEIRTVIDRNYDVVIDVDESQLNRKGMNSDIEWELREGAGVAAHGTSTARECQSGAVPREQSLGTFAGRAGHVYTLTLQVSLAAA